MRTDLHELLQGALGGSHTIERARGRRRTAPSPTNYILPITHSTEVAWVGNWIGSAGCTSGAASAAASSWARC